MKKKKQNMNHRVGALFMLGIWFIGMSGALLQTAWNHLGFTATILAILALIGVGITNWSTR